MHCKALGWRRVKPRGGSWNARIMKRRVMRFGGRSCPRSRVRETLNVWVWMRVEDGSPFFFLHSAGVPFKFLEARASDGVFLSLFEMKKTSLFNLAGISRQIFLVR